MSTARFIVGDVFDALATLPDDSIDLVMSSPPFLALRSYLPADHPDKAKEIGSEATPGEFLDTLLDVVEECARVLGPRGSLVFELGDTYAGSGGAGGDYNEGGMRDGQPKFTGTALSYRKSAQRNRAGGGARRLGEFPDRDAVPCPPRTGRRGLAAGGRTDRAADVEAGLTNGRRRPGPAERDSIDGWPLDKSKVLIPQLFAVALSYGFNPLTGRRTEPWRVRNVVAWCRPNPPVGRDGDKFRQATSYLIVATKATDRYWEQVRVNGSENTHARTAEGIESRETTGKSAAPERGGQWHTLDTIHNGDGTRPLYDWWEIGTYGYPGAHFATYPPELVTPIVRSMCPPGGTVLDPFAGSGTTLAVATGHGRDAIGIDIDERNAELARERVGGLFFQAKSLASNPR